MAEVFKGKSVTMEGFERLVAIKRIHPNLVENKKFLNMFLDEARLSLTLNHANIVQVFDLGRSGQTYFIVMEYIEGSNLKMLLDTLNRRDMRMPVACAVYTAIEMCKGLAHAHQKHDLEGTHLGIVHRDVSPPNVLLSTEGEVKLVDFGLAKGVYQAEITDPGVVKGKFGYLSPEAAYGHEVDVLADVFACGICLWEMLTGRRLFQGETDLKTLELVRRAEVPRLNETYPDVPPELDDIIAKTLAREKRDRFQSAQELGSELNDFLFNHALKVGSYDIASLVRQVKRFAMLNQGARRSQEVNNLVQQEIDKIIRVEQEGLELDAEDRVDAGHTDSPGDGVAIEFQDPRLWEEFSELDSADFEALKLKPGVGETAPDVPAYEPELDAPDEPEPSHAREQAEPAADTADASGAADAPPAPPPTEAPPFPRPSSTPRTPRLEEIPATDGNIFAEVTGEHASLAPSAQPAVSPWAVRIVVGGLATIMLLGIALFAILISR